ncbi:MAG: hypothetical protein GY796_11220 [Chloroflexi bacterium]|nr:hypothetical protein [Chloroflexota bacterium]
MTQVHQIYKLQETDIEIREKKQRLGVVLQTLNGPGWLLQAKERNNTADADLQHVQSQYNIHNLELKSLRQKAKSSENRLYSGKVTNPKELADLQGEIESLGRRASVQEDDVLEAMIMLEDAETEKVTATEMLTQAETRWEKVSVELETEKTELAVRLNTLLSLRQEQAKALTATTLIEYEHLAQKKGGTAVSRVRGELCLGCRTTISANKIKEAREGKKIYCGSCGRIIYPY